MSKNRPSNESAIALIELGLVIALLILTLAGMWFLLSRQDTKTSLNAAAFSAFNNKNNKLYTADTDGNTIPWNNTSVGLGVLTAVTTEFRNRVAGGSSLTASAQSTACHVKLGYLDLDANNGTALGTFSLIPDNIMSLSADQTLAFSLMQQEATNYNAFMSGKQILPPVALVTFKSDFKFNPALSPQIDQVYFRWHAFFTWACVIRKSLPFFGGQSTYSGIFVPKREFQ